MKKALSGLLVVLMLVSCASIAIAAEAPNGLLLPTIYIKGKMEAIYNDIGTADEWMVSDSSRVFSKEVTDVKEYAKEKAKELLPLFVIGLMTDNYGQWADGMSTLLEPIYRDFVLDKNGQPREGSGVKFDYTNLRNQVRGDGTYGTESYYFMHDWRLSPIDGTKETFYPASTSFNILAAGSTSYKSPKTGDNSNVALWAAVAVLSGGAVVALIPKKKKVKVSK